MKLTLTHRSRFDFELEVFEEPAPQGSKRHVGNGVMIESSKKVPAWRRAVKEAALLAFEQRGGWLPLTEPLEIWIEFYVTRPASVKRPHPIVPPDIDKLERGLFDALTIAGVWKDDSLVVRSHATKQYADLRRPGADLRIKVVEDIPLAIDAAKILSK